MSQLHDDTVLRSTTRRYTHMDLEAKSTERAKHVDPAAAAWSLRLPGSLRAWLCVLASYANYMLKNLQGRAGAVSNEWR
jgi:hypothetical protein